MLPKDIYFLQSLRKWIFIFLAALTFIVLYIMNNRFAGHPYVSIHDVLFIPELKSESDKGISDSFHLEEHHNHAHENEVGFVLRDSELGAPEFVGRNQKDMMFSDDDPNTFLNVEDVDNQLKPLFTNQDYPERNIAIGCAITTRNDLDLTAQTLSTHMPFFRGLLSSFCATATKGFNYHFYVAHDHSDPFFSTANAHDDFTSTFHIHLLTHCPKMANTTLHLVECHHSGRPAWAQNDAMMAAYMDHMDYYYRVNDDTILETTGWTEKFISELQRFTPPNVGVVGPWFKEGNIVILTHDFVHRTHVDIFGFYYPRVFTDWFADDWITNVYWPERSRKVAGTRVKHTMEKGQRYVAHYEKASKVKVESDIGKNIISRYIVKTVEGKPVGQWDRNATGVVAMSLYGHDVGLIYGCLRYAQLLPIMFPGWRMRVYVSVNESSSKVLKIMVKKLENFGVEVTNVNGSKISALNPQFWRYLIMTDLSVERFIIRDSTMRPSEREFLALEDWKSSEDTRPLYCIRDHASHSIVPLYPGMVGGIPKFIKSKLGVSIYKLLLSSNNEEQFLADKIWPKFSDGTFCHDSMSCHKWKGSHSYPMLRSANEFVGRKFDSNDQPISDSHDDHWNVDTTASEPCVILKNTGFDEKAVRAVVKLRPVLWSQDYHITPMMDVKSLLQPIGVRLIDNSLSYHCGKIGTCANSLKVINSGNGMILGPEIIDKFYDAYKNDTLMTSVTAFICTLPVSMCEAFRPFHKSMIVWASIRYEQARTEPQQWLKLNQMLMDIAHDNYSVLAANNLYDAKYIEYFTGLKPILIPNYCAYLTETYKPTKKQFLVAPIHSSELYNIFFAEFDNVVMRKDIDLVVFPLREIYPQYLYSDLASHKGIVYIPYQVSMISLTEQYRMNIPLFFPSLDLLTSWHIKYQVVKQRTWSGYLTSSLEKSNIEGLFPQVPDPNNDLDEEAIRYWLKFSDFYQWPHMIYFDSIDDLTEKMMKIDLDEVSRRMANHNKKVRQNIKSAWSDVLIRITAPRINYKRNKVRLVNAPVTDVRLNYTQRPIRSTLSSVDLNVGGFMTKESKVATDWKQSTVKNSYSKKKRKQRMNTTSVVAARPSKSLHNNVSVTTEYIPIIDDNLLHFQAEPTNEAMLVSQENVTKSVETRPPIKESIPETKSIHNEEGSIRESS